MVTGFLNLDCWRAGYFARTDYDRLLQMAGLSEAGLKCVQGKCIVNSISMKEGEAEFIARWLEITLAAMARP